MKNPSKINPQIKQTIINALMNVIRSAPTNTITLPFGYNPYMMPYHSPQPINPNEVTQARFDIWINYVNSTLQITSQYVDANLCFSVQNNIQIVTMQPGLDLITKINNICQIILDFTQRLINL